MTFSNSGFLDILRVKTSSNVFICLVFDKVCVFNICWQENCVHCFIYFFQSTPFQHTCEGPDDMVSVTV